MDIDLEEQAQRVKKLLTHRALFDKIVSTKMMTRETAMINTLEQALSYIAELEAENKALREELEYYKSRKPSGRKKHDETWMASYNDFAVKYESGMSIMEIVNLGEISRRTAYRYKSYYDALKQGDAQS